MGGGDKEQLLKRRTMELEREAMIVRIQGCNMWQVKGKQGHRRGENWQTLDSPSD